MLEATLGSIIVFLLIYHSRQIRLLKSEFKQREKKIREDAVSRSKSVTRGQVSEQILPLLPEFRYNPADARFLGAPIDYVIYEGMSHFRDTGEGEISIVFAEAKVGKSHRTKVQNKIREAIESGRVKFETIKLDHGLHNQGSDQSGEDA